MALCASVPDAYVLSAALKNASGVAVDRAPRRRSPRRPFPYRFRLQALDRGARDSEPILVVGQDLSSRGFGFEHRTPLPYRRVRLTACDPRLGEFGLGDLRIDVILRWCRFLGPGRYVSGGRIGHSVASLERSAESL